MKQEADLAAFLEIREAKSTEKKAAFQVCFATSISFLLPMRNLTDVYAGST